MNAVTLPSQNRVQMHMLRVGLPLCLEPRLQRKAAANLQAYISGSSKNTLIAFRTDVCLWTTWCAAFGIDPFAPEAEDVRDFVTDHDYGRKPGTVVRMVANISVLLARIIGAPNVTREEIVRGELRRIKRERGVKHKQALAIRMRGDVVSFDEPARPFSIDRMIEILEDDKSVWAARGKFLMSLGGETGRRKSEYCALNMQDVARSGDGTGLVEINRSKNDQEGKGIVRFACRRTMRLFGEWRAALAAAGGDVGPTAPAFVSIDQHGRAGGRLSLSAVSQVLRDVVREALTRLSSTCSDLDPEMIDRVVAAVSSHSFRVGFVQDLVWAGESLVAICVERDWCDASMPARYARNISARTGAAARLRHRLGD